MILRIVEIGQNSDSGVNSVMRYDRQELQVGSAASRKRSDYRRVFADSKKNALRREIPFDLTEDQFWRMVDRADGRCEVSELEFVFKRATDGQRRPFAPSLDRIDCEKGYSRSNTVQQSAASPRPTPPSNEPTPRERAGRRHATIRWP